MLDRQWLQALRARARQPPLRPRVPLWAGESMIGSVEPDFLYQIDLQPASDVHHELLKKEQPAELGWRLMGDVTLGLGRIATALQGAGLAGAWRNEQLAVTDQLGHHKGTVERAAVRPLGISTTAVHLAGQTPDGRFWVQQRALDKATDPGLWDTLVGGMVADQDTLESALVRETWEEAGLNLHALQGLRAGGEFITCRPSNDGRGAGYLNERIVWSVCTVPDGMVPQNQDGEVAQFGLMDASELAAALQREAFTLEAALIYAELLASAALVTG